MNLTRAMFLALAFLLPTVTTTLVRAEDKAPAAEGEAKAKKGKKAKKAEGEAAPAGEKKAEEKPAK